jgi:cystathionine beta-lyase
MNDKSKQKNKSSLDWRTRLIHSTADAPPGFRSLATPTYRGSTVVFENLNDAYADWRPGGPSTYGIYGTPTTLKLAARIAELETARHTFIVPSGMAANTIIYLAHCIPPLPPGEGRGEGALKRAAGAHVLTPETAYGNSFEVAEGLLAPLGIEVEAYDPMIGGDIKQLIRDNTTLIWTEAPGSITMEVQDVPAIVAAAHARNVPVALDNTYAAGVLFDAFGHGVDVSMQALTKYVGGHSDLLLGTVSVNSDAAMQHVGKIYRLLGLNVSPDDCSLALRGLQTLGVRLAQLEKSTLEVAKWLKARPEISLVLHPAFPDCPGHDIWKRDFTGSASVFSIVFSDSWKPDRIMRFVDALTLFKIGYSWGGVTSLVMAYESLGRQTRNYGRQLIRFNIGLEEPQDLINDLEQAMKHSS